MNLCPSLVSPRTRPWEKNSSTNSLRIKVRKVGKRNRERKAVTKGSVIKQLLLWATELNPNQETLGAGVLVED